MSTGPDAVDGGTTTPGTGRGGRRSALLVAGAIALVLVAGAALVVTRLLSGGGAQAAEALPGDAVAYVGVDFDPPAGQKIEIFQFLRKFPDARDEVGSEDDVQASFLDELLTEADCGLDYDTNVAPWLGRRAAFAARSVDGEVVPLLSLQVTDAEAAGAVLGDLPADCELGLDGVVVDGDYALLAPTQADADAASQAAAEADLASDETFARWTGEVGDDGVIEAYAAPEAAGVLLDELDSFLGELGALGPDEAATLDEMDEARDDFTGAAATLRFDDGTAELVAAFGDETTEAGESTVGAGELPATTAIALAAVGPPSGEAFERQLDTNPGLALLSELGAEVGLDLPADLLTILGSEFTLAVDNTVVEAVAPVVEGESPLGPAEVTIPVGAVTVPRDGETSDDVVAVVESLSDLLAPASLASQVADGEVAWGSDPAWLQSLIDPSQTLGDNERFVQVAPDAAEAQSVLFVDFGGQAVDDLVTQIQAMSPGDAQDVRDALGPLSGVGLTGTAEEGMTRLRIRVGTE